MKLPALAAILFYSVISLPSGYSAEAADSRIVTCKGDYQHHLQGVCLDGEGGFLWSFTTELVKTNAEGTVEKSIPVENHHGDLCLHGDKVYVAVNLGRFNDPNGNADSWVYCYDANTLEFLSKHPVPEVFHGAGGMDYREDRFYVVGGLPTAVEENYVYEYDESFHFVKKHILASGWTELGIQTALWHDGFWWFGCYGKPKILLKADAEFQMVGRYEFDTSLGLVGTGKDAFLVAKGPRTEAGRCRGELWSASPDGVSGLIISPPSKP